MGTARCGLALALLVLGACTSGNQPAESGIDAQLTECLTAAGQDRPMKSFYSRMQEDPAFAGAAKDCAAQLDVELPDPAEVRQLADGSVRELARCVRAAGWDVPEPTRGPSGTLVIPDIDAGIPADRHEEFEADVERCIEQRAAASNNQGPGPDHEHSSHPHHPDG